MKKYLIIIIIFLLILSCPKKKDSLNIDVSSYRVDKTTNIEKGSEEEADFVEYATDDEINSVIKNFNNNEYKPANISLKKPEYSIDKKYLNEEVTLNSIDYSKYPDYIGVVCTDKVKMYKEFPGKNILCEIPKGEIIEILEKHENPEVLIEDFKGLYEFNKEYNFWYKVKYGDKTGYVFGSYFIDTEYINTENTNSGQSLINESYVDYENKFKNGSSPRSVNIGSHIEENKKNVVKLSYYYKKVQKSPDFMNFIGFRDIDKKYADKIIDDRFTCEKVSKKEYQLDFYNPDDMSSLYMELHVNRAVDTFTTIDYLVHNQHLLFDRALENTESRLFCPVEAKFALSIIQKIEELEKQLVPENNKMKESITLLYKYFAVVYGLTISSSGIDKNLDEMKTKYPEIEKELSLINSADISEKSPIFGYNEDYTQYIPRGHYTKNTTLKKYFKAMMFMGRLHFYASLSPDHKEKSMKLVPASLVLLKILKENKDILSMWKVLYNPITYLIGESDDYNVYNYLEISNEIDFNNLGKWLENDENIVKFIKKANEKIDPPKISGNSLKKNLLDSDSISKETEIPQGFKLFGQRFTFDSYIHSILSSPRVGSDLKPRNMVKSLDVTAILGNKTANELLAKDKKEIDGYESNFKKLQNLFNSFTDKEFSSTFYNGYLKTISEMCKFNNEKPFSLLRKKHGIEKL